MKFGGLYPALYVPIYMSIYMYLSSEHGFYFIALFILLPLIPMLSSVNGHKYCFASLLIDFEM